MSKMYWSGKAKKWEKSTLARVEIICRKIWLYVRVVKTSSESNNKKSKNEHNGNFCLLTKWC